MVPSPFPAFRPGVEFRPLSDYADYDDRNISLWVTLGSPVGEPAVRECLYDSNEPPDGGYSMATWTTPRRRAWWLGGWGAEVPVKSRGYDDA